jgi:hypothetical protein
MVEFDTDRPEYVEPVTDDTVNVDSVSEPLAESIDENKVLKNGKKKSVKNTTVKNCKVLFWNKHSRNFAFEYDGTSVQVILDEPMETCGDTIKIKHENNKYEIVK